MKLLFYSSVWSAFLLPFGGSFHAMQLLGNTESEKQAYKQAYIEAKRGAGASFDLEAFNSSWLATHKDIRLDTGISEAEKVQPATDDKIERVTGEILNSDDIGGGDDAKLRAVVHDIVGAIDAYKVQRDIVSFSKVKNGTLQFGACLSSVCDNVVRPSRILKREAYDIKFNNTSSNNNAYNTDMLIKFIDIGVKLCGREGLCFNRALYMALTGVSDDYLREYRARLTSHAVNLWERVLSAEHTQSINFAYNSDIGNMRNLNEREAVVQREAGREVGAVGLASLRRIESN